MADRVGGYSNLLAIEEDGLLEPLQIAMAGEKQAHDIAEALRQASRNAGGP